eukprot:4641801-Pleurochrysis_carterae.AAC.1
MQVGGYARRASSPVPSRASSFSSYIAFDACTPNDRRQLVAYREAAFCFMTAPLQLDLGLFECVDVISCCVSACVLAFRLTSLI